MLVIGIMIAGAILSVNIAGGDRELEKERDRIIAITDYLRDQAALQNREFGMRCFEGGYEFLSFDARKGLWLRLTGDNVTQSRELPAGLELTLRVEGRPVILPPAQVKDDELAPQIMLFSSGDLSLFELTLQRRGGGAARFAPATNSDRIEVRNLAAGEI